MSDLREHVARSIRERKLFRRGERILVAVSGGLDSMALLHILVVLSARNRWQLFVAHFNHQLRGRSSDADERFVRKTAAGLKLPCLVGRGAVKSLAAKRGQSIEMAARELRHGFFARTAKRLAISTVALAHHADDQVELFFLRLLRGAGGEGIAGMKCRSSSPADPKVQLVRPFLDVSRAELDRYARENKIRSREDATNASRDFLRNRIRHELLPLLRRRFQPALSQTVLRFMDIAGAEAQFVEASARAWLRNPHVPFARLAAPVARRVLHLQLQRCKVVPSFDLVEALRLVPSEPVTVNPRIQVSRDEVGHVSVSSTSSMEFKGDRRAMDLKRRAGQGSFGGLRFRWRIANRRGAAIPRPSDGHEVFDRDKIGAGIVLRHWRPGDRFQPIGMRSRVKLQDWFTNQKIPRQRRREMVVATAKAGEIFWVEGQRIGDAFKLTATTRRRLIWRWKRP